VTNEAKACSFSPISGWEIKRESLTDSYDPKSALLLIKAWQKVCQDLLCHEGGFLEGTVPEGIMN